MFQDPKRLYTSGMPTPPAVCQAWFGFEAVVCASLATDGFSGAATFMVGSGGERFVLKGFPAGFPRPRAEWVHALMRHLRQEGIVEVPAVIPARGGETVVADADGQVWELVGFVPGAPVDPPSPAQACAGLEALARLHLAAARLPGEPVRAGRSPGHLRRIEQARRLLADPWRRRRERLCAAGAGGDPDRPAATGGFGPDGDRRRLLERLDAAIERFEEAGGRRAVELVARSDAGLLPLQAVLRDVWSDHLLFVVGERDTARGQAAGGRLAGIVDYHAAGIDTPATDIARLLGSWRPMAGDDGTVSMLEAWGDAIAAYDRVRPLTAGERAAVPFLRATSVILGLDNWFRWTLEEDRRFSEPARVCARIDRLVEGLAPAIEETIGAAANLD